MKFWLEIILFVFFTSVFGGTLSTFVTPKHASRALHERDIENFFGGYSSGEHGKFFKKISSWHDNECPQWFREKFGSVPGNHRIVGHKTPLGRPVSKADEEQLRMAMRKSRNFQKKYEKKTGRKWCKQEEDRVIREYRKYHNASSRRFIALAKKLGYNSMSECRAIVEKGSLAHFKGDLTSDNKMVSEVKSLREVWMDDLACDKILLSKSAFGRRKRSVLKILNDDSLTEYERADKLSCFDQQSQWDKDFYRSCSKGSKLRKIHDKAKAGQRDKRVATSKSLIPTRINPSCQSVPKNIRNGILGEKFGVQIRRHIHAVRIQRSYKGHVHRMLARAIVGHSVGLALKFTNWVGIAISFYDVYDGVRSYVRAAAMEKGVIEVLKKRVRAIQEDDFNLDQSIDLMLDREEEFYNQQGE